MAGLLLLDPVVTIFTILYFALIAFMLQRIMSTRASHLGKYGAEIDIASIVSVQEVIGVYREITVANQAPLHVKRFYGSSVSAATVR